MIEKVDKKATCCFVSAPPPGPPPTSEPPNNPGTIEELHKKAQAVFPMYFEGAKLLVNKALSSHFQVSHTMTMSSAAPSGYRFGATYVGTKMLSPSEVSLQIQIQILKQIVNIL